MSEKTEHLKKMAQEKLSGVREQLENVGFVEDDVYYLGDGPDIR